MTIAIHGIVKRDLDDPVQAGAFHRSAKDRQIWLTFRGDICIFAHWGRVGCAFLFSFYRDLNFLKIKFFFLFFSN